VNTELNFKFIITATKKYLPYIIVITLIFTGIAAVISFTATPVYSVTATFYSINVAPDYDYSSSQLVSAQQDLVNDYIEIIKSDKMLTVVRDDLKENGYENTSVGRIRSMISASQIDETSAFTVSVSGIDTKEIKDTMTAICENVGDVIDSTQQREHAIEVLTDTSELTVKKVSPRTALNLASGFAIGFFGSFFFFLIVAYYDRTVRAEEDLKKRFDLPIIGVIPTWDK